MSNVPFLDLDLQHAPLRAEIRLAIDHVIDTNGFILGPAATEFEEQFAKYCNSPHAVGLANGTDAVHLGLRAAGIGEGDEVILPANTFVATVEGVVAAGARPVLVDCDDHYLLDVEQVQAAVTPRTRAVVAVHLYGQTAPVEQVRAIVGDDVLVMEDAAQSQGARRHDQPSGGLGDVASTSFYPGKNLGAFGDAGAVTCTSAEVAERLRRLRNHGGTQRYEHLEWGTNSRLDGIQAAVLSIKLRHLDGWNAQRRTAAALYEELLGDVEGITTPTVLPGNEPVWHLYVVRVRDRDRVRAELESAGIGVGIHYPAPLHRLEPYRSLDRAGGFPVADGQADHILSLPIFPGITPEQQTRVADVLRAAISQ